MDPRKRLDWPLSLNQGWSVIAGPSLVLTPMNRMRLPSRLPWMVMAGVTVARGMKARLGVDAGDQAWAAHDRTRLRSQAERV